MYLSPSTINHIRDLEQANNLFLGRDPIVVGGLNVDFIRLQNLWNQQVVGFKVLEEFFRRVSWKIVGMTAQSVGDLGWEWSLAEKSL